MVGARREAEGGASARLFASQIQADKCNRIVDDSKPILAAPERRSAGFPDVGTSALTAWNLPMRSI